MRISPAITAFFRPMPSSAESLSVTSTTWLPPGQSAVASPPYSSRRRRAAEERTTRLRSSRALGPSAVDEQLDAHSLRLTLIQVSGQIDCAGARIDDVRQAQ